MDCIDGVEIKRRYRPMRTAFHSERLMNQKKIIFRNMCKDTVIVDAIQA